MLNAYHLFNSPLSGKYSCASPTKIHISSAFPQAHLSPRSLRIQYTTSFPLSAIDIFICFLLYSDTLTVSLRSKVGLLNLT